MAKAVILGGLYFAIVFAFAFALGILRVVVIAPAIGALSAVLIEVPVVIGASWIVATRLLRHHCLSTRERVMMGGIAFALLMVAEASLARTLSGQSIRQWATAVMTPIGLIGFAGQVIFGLMPLFTRRSTAQLYP
jgi:hypothetical protein